MNHPILFWFLFGISICTGQCCGPAEIGEQYSIMSTKTAISSIERVSWQVGKVTLYDSAQTFPNLYPNLYVGTKRQLTLKNVTTDGGTVAFQHFVNAKLVYTCTLPVYKKATTPKCEPVTLNGKQIRTTCTTAQVFPKAKCQFSLENGGTDTRDIANEMPYITYTHTDPKPGGNEHYSTSCTLQYPVDGLKPGNWTVQVNMYPDLTGVSLAQGTIGQAFNTLSLYGPSSASLTFQPPGPLYLCPTQQTNIVITCKVPENSFSPAILFTIQDGTSINLVTKVGGDTAQSKSVNYNFTKSGQHTFMCRVENAIFSDIFSKAPASTIDVYEPPSSPPKIFAQSSQNDDILVVGDDVTVTCDVQGGYPTVHSVTLTCGHDQTVMSASKDGTSAQLILNKIQQTCNAINCTCQATHVTGCYDLINVLPLTVFSFNPYQTDKYTFTTAELVGEIIGVIVGTLVLEAVIALIVFFIRRETRKRKNRTKDTEYDKVRRQAPLPYQNITHQDPNYQTVNPTEQAPNSASANQETDRTYRNQAYGDYEEPIELDTNAYSEIQAD